LMVRGHLCLQRHLSGMVDELTVPRGIPATTVADAAAGDVAALARIVAAHHDDMARICYVICGDQDTAQDAVQAAWPIAWRKLGSLRDPDRLRPWLMAVAANQARQMLRRQRRHVVVEIEIADVGSYRFDPGARAEQVDLATALRRLTPEDRTLLALRHVAGYDATEIGREMGISPSGVRSRLARLTARLRTELEDV
jgi:RNA polymerase sigma-70 factor (ECF subfamily)